MLTSPRSLWRLLMLTVVAAAFVCAAAPDASAAKKKKAKAAAKAVAPVKAEPAKAADPSKPVEPAKAAEPAKPAESAKAAALDVTDLWNAKCKACHGPDGKGKPPKTEDMTAGAWQKRFTDAQIRKTIVEGFERDKDGSTQKMKAFSDFSPAQLDGLVAHVRGFGK